MKQFAAGEKVMLSFNPSFMKGKPNSLRLNNRIGVVIGKQGGSFKVEFKDGNKTKMLVLANVHLKKV